MSDLDLRPVLEHWPDLRGASARPFGRGLINRTFLVEGARGRAVLQQVNPIFPAAIHANIVAVTTRLRVCGLETPALWPTAAGAPCLELDGAVWRVQSFIDGACGDVVHSAAQARAAGALVGRFHAALDGLAHEFVGQRVGVHDTPRHLAALQAAVTDGAGHALWAEVAPLGDAIRAGAAALPPLPPLAAIVGHGDLKLNNVVFAGAAPPACEQARCLIDLDTVGPVALAYELGDAWRSWCNRSGEDATGAVLDLETMAASFAGYRDGRGGELDPDARQALLLGPEWVSLELAARFGADALRERYFGWDATRYPSRGAHNLARARGQWALHQELVATRAARARLLGAG